MISGKMASQWSFLSIVFGFLATGFLLQLLLPGTIEVAVQAQEVPIPTAPAPPLPPIESTIIATSATTTTVTVPTKKPTTTKPIVPTTIDSSGICWAHSNRSSEACFSCNICKTGPSGGAVAGIVVGVLLVYIVSLILVAIVASVLTKRGKLDLSKWRLTKLIFGDGKEKNSSTELADPEMVEQNEYTEGRHPSSSQELYTALNTSSREATQPEPSPYQSLQKNSSGGGGDRKTRNQKPRIKTKKPTSAATAVPEAATDDEIYQNY